MADQAEFEELNYIIEAPELDSVVLHPSHKIELKVRIKATKDTHQYVQLISITDSTKLASIRCRTWTRTGQS